MGNGKDNTRAGNGTKRDTYEKGLNRIHIKKG